MNPKSPSFLASRSGLTLVELLVVLSIIAVLSTVAVRSVAQVAEEKRYDANLAQLEIIRLAVLGDSETVGFFGDIGRLPIAQGSLVEEQLSELWLGGGLPSFSIQTPAGDSEVRLGVGWRGPYIGLGLARNELSDTFGRDLVLYEANGDSVVSGESIAIVQSLGSDGTSGGSGVNADVASVLKANSSAVGAGLSSTTVATTEDIVVTIVNESGNILEAEGDYVLVRVYGPSFAADGSGGLTTLAQQLFDFSSTSDNPGGLTELPSVSLSLSGLPIGPKVLRAYQVAHSTAPTTTEDLTEQPAVAPTAGRSSVALHTVLNGRSGALTLTLLAR